MNHFSFGAGRERERDQLRNESEIEVISKVRVWGYQAEDRWSLAPVIDATGMNILSLVSLLLTKLPMRITFEQSKRQSSSITFLGSLYLTYEQQEQIMHCHIRNTNTPLRKRITWCIKFWDIIEHLQKNSYSAACCAERWRNKSQW